MNYLDEVNGQQTGKSARPTWLTVICVLTFIGSGISTVSFLMVYFSYEVALPLMQELGGVIPGMELFATAGRNFFLTGFILYFLSLMGARLMWQLRKIGFHFYAASQVMLVLLPVVYIKGFPFSFIEASLTAVFILFYSRFLKLMS